MRLGILLAAVILSCTSCATRAPECPEPEACPPCTPCEDCPACPTCEVDCDMDGDGATGTSADHAIFMESYGKYEGEEGYSEAADFDGDGYVSSYDYSLYLEHCMETYK